MAGTIWLYDDPSATYHDTRCQCERHCGNCFTDLDQERAQIESMIERGVVGPNGPYTAKDRLHPRARYCSPYCKGRAARERKLDRTIAANCRTAMRS
jgi:hypothetical protein